jgi:hypothetical protein
MILNLLIYFTLLSLALLFKAIADDNDSLLPISIVSLICIFIFGWIIIGTSMDKVSIEVKQKPIEALKGKHIGVIVFDTHTFMVKDYELEKITDKSTYYYKVGYNIYNYVTDTTLIIK